MPKTLNEGDVMRKQSSEFQRVQMLKGKLLLNEESKGGFHPDNESSVIELRREIGEEGSYEGEEEDDYYDEESK